MADWDWATWALVVGCSLVVLLPLFAVAVILFILFHGAPSRPQE